MVTQVEEFREYLISEEKTAATIEKYLRDVRIFLKWLGRRSLEKALVLEYKSMLCERYAPASVNAAISSLNSFFSYINRYDCRVKALKIQRQIFSSSDRELTKVEYERLLSAARKKRRLYLLMQTICSTGIRVSEVRYITAAAVKSGYALIDGKGKLRKVFLPKRLCKMLNTYIKRQGISSGAVFITKSGRPLDRSNIWAEMKKLCQDAGVARKKVFPHNLRHLFARTYYSLQKDIVRLADILGHSSINTTRIYTMETGEIHQKQIEQLGLLKC